LTVKQRRCQIVTKNVVIIYRADSKNGKKEEEINMKSEVIRLRLDSAIIERLRKQAQDNERTIAKEIQYMLKKIPPSFQK
jgi:hypothetical protein